jgi:glycine/D-amino acid oxidase-like deaminating enzyme
VAVDPAFYGQSWYAATAVEQPPRERLVFDLDVDVCVVGGGLAGLTVAREIAIRGWSVAVLEARRIAWNASGRNTGFVLPGFAQPAERIIARVGRERARALWALSLEGVEYVRRTIAELAMPGVDPVSGWLLISKIDRAKEVAAEASLLRDEFKADVETWPTELVRQKLQSPRYYQAIHFPTAFHIHPLNYALGLAKAAEASGVRIFEETPALQIDPAGVRKRVVTPGGRVRATHIVLAGNVHLGDVVPEISETLVPVSTYVITTEPLGDKLNDAITYRGAVSDTEMADNHYRIVGGDRLMWSGRVTTWESDPKRLAKRLRADIARTYPQLGKPDVAFAWIGTLGRSVHRMPQIGEISPGLWLASGFGGHGLNTTAMAGRMIASGILDGDTDWRLLLPYELVWAGGKWGRGAAQAAYYARRMRETFLARLSREAEAAALRAKERAARQAGKQAARKEETRLKDAAKAAARAAAEDMRKRREEPASVEAARLRDVAQTEVSEPAIATNGARAAGALASVAEGEVPIVPDATAEPKDKTFGSS